MGLPKTEIATFDELIREWGGHRLNWGEISRKLYDYVTTGKITPSIYVNLKLEVEQVCVNEHGDLWCDFCWDQDPKTLSGIYYLNIGGFGKGINSFYFESVSKNPKPQIGDIVYGLGADNRGDGCFFLNLETDEIRVPNSIFFVREEIDRFEREYMQGQTPTPAAINSSQNQEGQALHNTHLMKIAIEVQKAYWPTLDASPKQEVVITEIMEKYALSRAEAQAVERVACPIDRKK